MQYALAVRYRDYNITTLVLNQVKTRVVMHARSQKQRHRLTELLLYTLHDFTGSRYVIFPRLFSCQRAYLKPTASGLGVAGDKRTSSAMISFTGRKVH